MRRNHVLVVAVAALLVIAVAWLLMSPAPKPSLPPPARPVPLPPALALRATHGVAAPSGVIAPTVEAKPCVRGWVVNAATNAGVPNAQVVFATTKGALQVKANEQGVFDAVVEDSERASLAEVSAEGFFPFRPEWGHSPIELELVAGRCVTDLVLSLTPKVEYRGWVVGPTGEPVVGARVTIANADEAPGAPLTSDAEGGFRFFAPEGAVVVARHPDFAPAVASIDFRVGVTKELVLRLGARETDAGVARATLSGVVLDVRDGGVPGAQVKALQTLSEQGPHVEGATESDVEGRFRLEVEGPGPWTLVGHVPGLLTMPVTTKGEPVVLRLVAGTELRGRVHDASGKPVQSFVVMIGRKDGPLRIESETAHSVVDAEGRFAIRGLPPGPVRVVVGALGYAPSEPNEVELSPQALPQLDVTLKTGAKVAGQVVDRKTKAPLQRARVSLESQEDATLTAMPAVRTDGEGRFVLGGIAPGRRSLFVTSEQHHARLVSVETKADETTGPLVIDLGPLEKGEDPRLELVGIGAVLEAKGDALVLKQVMPKGGAAEAGLVAGDGILSIDGASAAKLGFAGGVEAIRGAENTFVNLEVRRLDGSVVTLAVPRRRIEN